MPTFTAHRSTMPQINMITRPVTLNWANQPLNGKTLTREATVVNVAVFVRISDLPHSERTLYPLWQLNIGRERENKHTLNLGAFSLLV